jgi:hypothetical protein
VRAAASRTARSISPASRAQLQAARRSSSQCSTRCAQVFSSGPYNSASACLLATLAEDPVEATGTVLRAPTLASWAAAAGFTGFEVLAIDNPFWRFYRLRG